jgi:HSP20 family protein
MKLKNRIDQALNSSFGDMQIDLESFVDQIFGEKKSACGTSTKPSCHWTPRTDVSESDTKYTIEMELPGFEATAVNVEIKEGVLQVSGERKKPEAVEGTKVVRRERVNGAFSRRFEFATQVDAEKIEASFKLGILTLHVPKSEEELARKIEIKVAE